MSKAIILQLKDLRTALDRRRIHSSKVAGEEGAEVNYNRKKALAEAYQDAQSLVDDLLQKVCAAHQAKLDKRRANRQW